MSKVLIVDLVGNQPLNLYTDETYSFNINVSPNRFYIQTTAGAAVLQLRQPPRRRSLPNRRQDPRHRYCRARAKPIGSRLVAVLV